MEEQFKQKMKRTTKEPQYQIQFDLDAMHGSIRLGPGTGYLWRSDPRHLGFLLARYKFCAKILSGRSNVLEVGCGDAFAMDVVLQEVEHVHGVDFDPLYIEDAKVRYGEKKNRSFEVVDFTQDSVDRVFDSAYSLDVIEHIPKEKENAFLKNICKILKPQGICILGTPSAESQTYASELSKIGHVNCKSGTELKELLLRHFHNVFIFCMNDEMVHLGFYPMAHYLFGMGVGVRTAN